MLKKKMITVATTVVVGAMSLVGCSNDKEVSVTKDNEIKISMILDEGGVNDQSFNQSSWEGALKAKEKYGVDVNYIESKQESDYEANIETAIDNGSDLIIGVGFKIADAIKVAAENYPQQSFAIIDGTYDEIPKNLQPILFNEEQAGYSVGLIAGKMTTTNKIGFIGGMDIPSVTNFLIGFEKGAKEVNPEIEVLSQYANSFTDAAKGKAIAQQMIQSNADILFTCGGGVNNGAWEACSENNIKAIGVDMPSSQFSPNIVTSALKNVGTGVELTIKDLVEGNFVGGAAKIYDLSNGGVGYEDTEHLTDEIRQLVEEKISK